MNPSQIKYYITVIFGNSYISDDAIRVADGLGNAIAFPDSANPCNTLNNIERLKNKHVIKLTNITPRAKDIHEVIKSYYNSLCDRDYIYNTIYIIYYINYDGRRIFEKTYKIMGHDIKYTITDDMFTNKEIERIKFEYVTSLNNIRKTLLDVACPWAKQFYCFDFLTYMDNLKDNLNAQTGSKTDYQVNKFFRDAKQNQRDKELKQNDNTKEKNIQTKVNDSQKCSDSPKNNDILINETIHTSNDVKNQENILNNEAKKSEQICACNTMPKEANNSLNINEQKNKTDKVSKEEPIKQTNAKELSNDLIDQLITILMSQYKWD